ncbi:1,2-diacylglycerol 3-alpha-glucosyltransferase [Peptoniphilus asaccharolyticus DSM 20463]|uniref:1,2-diacylglycerol 3-alpha-glucosyltransferase n=1 Tax=Peptoniphilus asaccharolyticus DSM 20463 TaxID=573058 RepID=A0A1W1UYZ1_PEPAS|nr:glycosyltransferase [Peptoniphilus asaccharolyticus]MBL7575331.1 glycosyltransferase [Peptoniphilus asaccharolyticus]SMB85961.1 1,2-diacylglycerol 3-alpha-glucosyltransferase [Peptoniphilus asaccharolyticus DSM 20463]
MKVLIATDLYKPQINGVVTSVLNLSEELRKLGVEVRILTLSNSFKSHYENGVYYISSFPVKVYPDIRASLSVIDPIILSAIEWRPDIIHTQNEFSTFNFARIIATAAKCPIVHTYHTMYEHYVKYVTKHQKAGEKFLHSFLKRVFKSCQRVIAPTAKAKESLIDMGMNVEIDVIPTGIDLSKFSNEVDILEKNQIKEKYNIEKDDFLFMFLGRVAKEKNLDEVIENFVKLQRDYANISFLIVGGGPYLDELKKKVSHEKIVFTGMVSPDEVGKYYGVGDAFLCASQSETQGLTFVEALANSLPLLCKPDECLDGLLEVGFNGYYFNNYIEFKESAEVLFDKVVRDKLRKNAYISSKKYSKENFAMEVLELYKMVLLNYNYISLPKRPIVKVKKMVKKYKTSKNN